MTQISQLALSHRNRPFTRGECWAMSLAAPAVVGPLWSLALWPNHGWLGTLAGSVLVGLLTVSTFTDLAGHKIYNWATYSALLWAVVINLLAPLLASPAMGAVGLSNSLAGFVLCGIFTLLGFQLSGGGAGDVKLAAAIGALLGPSGFYAIACTYVVAAAAILAWTAWTHGPLVLLKAAFRKFAAWCFPSRYSTTAADQALLLKPIPLAPYFAVGTMLYLLEGVWR